MGKPDFSSYSFQPGLHPCKQAMIKSIYHVFHEENTLKTDQNDRPLLSEMLKYAVLCLFHRWYQNDRRHKADLAAVGEELRLWFEWMKGEQPKEIPDDKELD